jgi:hypothetical protein
MKEIVSNINAQIEVAAMLGNMALYGVADPIVVRDESESVFPVIIADNGECYDVLLDDSKDVSLYHRLNMKTYGTVNTAGYGDKPQQTIVYDMAMVVCGRRDKINPHDMERACVFGITNTTNAKQRITCEVTTSNFNRLQVFTGEYTGVQFPIQPDIFLFKINYKITRTQSPCQN